MKTIKGDMTAVSRLEKLAAVRSVRDGLINIIPVLIIGAFALILKTFPFEAYQNFIKSFSDGFLFKLFDTVYAATFGLLSVYMTVSISRAYMKIAGDHDSVFFGATTASLISFFILVGGNLLPLDLDALSSDTSFSDLASSYLGPKSMFLALITSLGASAIFLKLSLFFRGRQKTLFSSGADRGFNRMLSTILPIVIIVTVVALLNISVVRIFNVDSLRMLINEANNLLFSVMPSGFFRGFFFVLFSSVLWMFGIHGSDTLEEVMQTYFATGLDANRAAIAAGAAPTEILTKEFFDCFVLMGGCGATICLLIALLLFSRNRARRGLAYTAALPMIFNINELMVFGIPIIFNPVMLIPFLTVPLVCYSVSYLAIASGLVPFITSNVEWTTPIILGGFRATGSFAGSALQLVNAALGVLIYMPFVKLLDKRTDEQAKFNYSNFIKFFKENEAALFNEKLTELKNEHGEFAKGLSAEILHGIRTGQIILAYQPQYHYDGRCVGVEALLRWKHPVHGIIYPPLVVKLASDGDYLPDLEEAVVNRAIADRKKVYKKFGDGIKISFNVTGTTVITERFLSLMSKINAEHPFEGSNLCVEITEQATLAFDEKTHDAFNRLRSMGLLLAIDDFSMGQTSLNYLKDNMFDIIKLDGSLVKGLSSHANCREIISSIVGLSKTLNLMVLAEYVETDWDRETLHGIGCDCYQGYLYSPAVFLDD